MLCLFIIFFMNGLISGDSKCGVEFSPRLIHRNPWVVFLEYYRHEHLTELRCGGTLVSSRDVITAAHCVKKKRYSRLAARLGEYDLTSTKDCVEDICADPIVRIDVSKIIIPDNYDGKSHDIAVLKLEQEAPYNDFIRPICLPSGNLEEDGVFTATGWGEIPLTGQYSDIKKIIIPLPNWSIVECQKAYGYEELPEQIICAGGVYGIDTCRGDSGGPLILIRSVAELWGITSAGNVNCGTKDYPGIYTSVIEHLDWIHEQINN